MTLCGVQIPQELIGRSFLLEGRQWMAITDYLDIVAWGGSAADIQKSVEGFMQAVEKQASTPPSALFSSE